MNNIKLILENWQKFLQEEMKTEPPEGFIVFISGDRRQIHIKIRSKDKVGSSPRFPEGRYKYVGEIHIDRSISVDEGTAYEVESAFTDKGFGPLLYDIAMEMVYLLGGVGLMPDRTSVSPAARKVWEKYFTSRSDVEHKELPQDLFDTPKMADRKEYMRYYYYKNDAPTIYRLKEADKLISDDFNI